MLTAGILYGAYHHSRLSKKEALHRKIEAEKKVVRDAQEAILKKKRAEGKFYQGFDFLGISIRRVQVIQSFA